MDLLALARSAISATPPRKKSQVQALFSAWVTGDLATMLCSAGVTANTLEADRALGRYFSRLPGETTNALRVQRPAHNLDDVRRWCWAVGWSLSFDDEDLVLMRDDYAPVLLDEAAFAPAKGGEATEIVAHHCRDQAHATLWSGDLHAVLRRVAEWLPLARKTPNARVIAYMERLVSYGATREVNEDEAKQRVFDLRRCNEKRNTPPEIREAHGQWIASFDHSNRNPAELFIDRATGAMQARER